MPTTVCPHCQTGYPDVLSACPSCGKAAQADTGKKPVDLKKVLPLIVIMDLLVIAVVLFVYFTKK